MVVQSIAATILAPVHLLVYSTFLGTQLYQSFVMVKVAHQALPLEAFTLFQKRAFFVYFRAQSILLVLTVATFPPTGPIRLAKSKGDLVPLLIGGITALLNWMVFGPRTSRDMMMRRFQRMLATRKGQKMKLSIYRRNKKLNCTD